jgi:hypothetical protein
MEDSPAPLRAREPAWLVGPLATLLAVTALLVAARFHDHLPVHPPACGFRKLAGLPCVGCGGTRSARALAAGRIGESIRFNPGVVLGVATTIAWTAAGSARFLRRVPLPKPSEQNRRIRRNAVLAAVLLLLNWIYLVFFLT